MGKAELLAPAGGWQSMVAAVQNGADAVYFGTGGFNARASAANFLGEEAARAIDYCHERRVKAYLTLNTLILDKEIDAVLKTARQLYEYGADAFIVQDMGLISILQEQMPDMPLHGSTQMTIHNASGVRMAKKIGLQRVVLSRETSMEDIRHIKVTVPSIGLEAFVHGAMCVSVSGQCLLSSFIGERSGNRGACAQPCRLPYELGSRDGYLLSMKDLCMLEHIQELSEAGVESFKIEGRMKRPEYVAVVTQAYRKAIDGEIKDMHGELLALKKIFDRGEFSAGYYFGREGQVDTSRSGNIGSDIGSEQLKQAKESFEDEKRHTPVDAVFYAQEGEPAKLTLTCGSHSSTVSGDLVQLAISAPLDEQKTFDALSKLGGTPYKLEKLRIIFEDKEGKPCGIFLPVRALNELRRNAVTALRESIVHSFHRKLLQPVEIDDKENIKEHGKPLIVARVSTLEQAKAALGAGADEIQAGIRHWDEATVLKWSYFAKNVAVPVYVVLPPVLMNKELDTVMKLLANTAFTGAIAGNIGQIEPLKTLFDTVLGDYTLNITNTLSAKVHRKLGLKCAAVSVELTLRQICAIIKRMGGDIILYGTIPMMSLLHCPIRRTEKGCAEACATGHTIKDRKGYVFSLLPLTIIAKACNVQLLNCVPLDGLKFFDELKDVPARAWALLFYMETVEQVCERVSAYREALAGGDVRPLAGATGGHLARGVK